MINRSIMFVYVFQLLLKSAHYSMVWTISPNLRQICRKWYVLWNGIGISLKKKLLCYFKNLIMNLITNPDSYFEDETDIW